jgi:cytochrome c oxidase assembly protein subunit 15
VLARLTPVLVAAHLIIAMLLLAAATALHWRAGRQHGLPGDAAPRAMRMLARLVALALAAVILLGTVATGSGPDAGSPDVPRLGLPFRDMAELHAVAAMFLVGLTAASYFALRLAGAGQRELRCYAMLAAAVAGQGVVGYAQYLTGLPAGLVEVHIVGAGVLVIAATRFSLAVGAGRSRRTAGA